MGARRLRHADRIVRRTSWLTRKQISLAPESAITQSWSTCFRRITARCCHPKKPRRRIFEVKNYIEENLCRELNLMMVTVPLIVDEESGVNDYLDRDGSRTPIQFHISNDRDKHPINAQVVQAATKWKRMALKQFGMQPGEGLCTDMRAVRKDYFLDHDHSAYVDQWDWERVITADQRNLSFPERSGQQDLEGHRGGRASCPGTLSAIERPALSQPARGSEVPPCRGDSRPVPRFTAQAARDRYPAKISRGIHYRHRLDAKDGYPHEMRAADYDDWVTETRV